MTKEEMKQLIDERIKEAECKLLKEIEKIRLQNNFPFWYWYPYISCGCQSSGYSCSPSYYTTSNNVPKFENI